jgi:hypothetical protein
MQWKKYNKQAQSFTASVILYSCKMPPEKHFISKVQMCSQAKRTNHIITTAIKYLYVLFARELITFVDILYLYITRYYFSKMLSI